MWVLLCGAAGALGIAALVVYALMLRDKMSDVRAETMMTTQRFQQIRDLASNVQLPRGWRD